MTKLSLFCLFVALFVSSTWSSPLLRSARDAECTGNALYQYDTAQEYTYNYRSNTTLWINDVSDEAKSNIELSAQVLLQRTGPCYYQISLQNVNLAGSTVQNPQAVADELTRNVVKFNLNSNGALAHESIKFSGQIAPWARNVKRAIISAFQLRSDTDLRSDNPLEANVSEKSAIVYETDVLGRCRTEYKFDRLSPNSVKIEKEKAVHSCSLDEFTSSPVQSVPYKNIAEYYPGRLYIDSHECNALLNNGILQTIGCTHKSTYRFGSNGDNGVQAVAQQRLTYDSQKAATPKPILLDRSAPLSIVHEYTAMPSQSAEFDAAKEAAALCKEVPLNGLNSQHADNFRRFVLSLRSKSPAELAAIVAQASKACKIAGQAAVSAIIYSESDASVEAALALMDQDALSESRLISEYPALTGLARNRNPSEALINKLKAYVASKDSKFPYINKLYLIYSSLVNTYCDRQQCSNNELDNWTSFLGANLGSNCQDAKSADLVVSSLKAIGNIGYLKNTNVIEQCAQNKANNLETRVSAIQAQRRFSSEDRQNLNANYAILKDSSDDSEVRIKAFLALVPSLNSAKFQTFAANEYGDLLAQEHDLQVVSFIADYAKEHGITVLLNPILNDPSIKEKLQTNFKEFSWNNFRYRYDLVRDSALEVDTSVVYTPKTFLPRSINFNLTAHLLGFSVNGIDVTLRLEGLDEVLKAVLVDKIPKDLLLQRLMEKQQLLPILQALADKLKYTAERPYVSLSIRIYGSEVFFSQLDSAQELQQLASLVGGGNFYNPVEMLRNLYLINNYNKKALANGLEFCSCLDAALSLYKSRSGAKQDSGAFNFKALRSASLALTRQFNVELNDQNKLSLKKDVTGQARFKVNAEGTRKEGEVQYNFNLAPEDVTLLQLEGKFSKLSANGAYVPVNNFKVPRHQVARCSSENFQKNVGVQFCINVDRPEYRRFRDILKNVQDFQLDEDDADDVEDVDDDRPKATLAGPYRYQLSLKNPNGIRALSLNAKWSKEGDNKNAVAVISSVDAKGVKRQVDITYSRNRQATSRSYVRAFDLDVRGSGTQDSRFKLNGALNYKKKDLLSVTFNLDNKILRDYNVLFTLNRTHNEDNLVSGTYHIEALYKSQVFTPRHHHFLWTIRPQASQLHSDLSFESLSSAGKLAKIVEAQLRLDPRVENSADPNYNVVLTGRSISGRRFDLTGVYQRSLLESNIDLKGDYNSPNVPKGVPMQVKVGHKYGGETAESVLFADLTVPQLGVSHGGKIGFLRGPTQSRIALELSSPKTKAAQKPYTISYSRNSEPNAQSIVFGFENLNIDLSQRTSNLARVLANSDGNTQLNSLKIALSRVETPAGRTEATLEVNKNDNSVLKSTVHRYGSLPIVFESFESGELPEQKLGAGLSFSVLEYQGAISADASAAFSRSKDTHDVSLIIKAENAFKTLLRLSDFNLKRSYNAGQVSANLKINREGGNYKSFGLSANGQVRKVAGQSEIDIQYVKVLNNGVELRKNGIARFTSNAKDKGSISFDVPSTFSANLDVQRGADKKSLQFGYKHLDDGQPRELKAEVLFENKELGNGMTNKVLVEKLRVGAPGLAVDTLTVLFDLNVDRTTASGGQILAHTESLKYKSKRFNADIDSSSSMKVDAQNRKVVFNSNTVAQLPALFSHTGGVVSFKRQISGEISLDFQNVKYSHNFETDSPVLGRFFRFFNLKYAHQGASQPGRLIAAQIESSYKLGWDEKQELRSSNIDFSLDNCADAPLCLQANANIKRNSGHDCQFKAGLQRNNSILNRNEDAKLYASLDLSCNNVQLTHNHLQVERTLGESVRRSFEIHSESAVYEPKRFRIAFGPLDRKVGNVELAVQLSKTRSAEYAIEFNRDRDESTGRLNQATWKLRTKLGENKAAKSCELNIRNQGQDYSNQLQCQLSLDSKSYSYGYNFVLYNKAEVMFGQRKFDFDLSLPVGRQLRVEYQGSRASPIDGTDDDEDPNDEREFNATANLYWDYSRDKSRSLVVQVKRDNYAKGKFRVFANVASPDGRQARVEFNHVRTFNDTNLNLAVSYDLKNNVKNQLDISGKLSSDLTDNRFEVELGLAKPKFNVLYSNVYNKYNGRLKVLNVRVAELLNLRVDKEYDQNARRISLELYQSNSLYQATVNSAYENDKYTVTGVLSRNGQKKSEITSVFDNNLASLNVQASGNGNSYQFNFGLLSETAANGFLKRNNEIIALGRVSVEDSEDNTLDSKQMVVALKWNRFWHQFQTDLLGSESDSAVANARTNSYFGDTYAQVSADLRPVVEALRAQRLQVRQDLIQSLILALQYYQPYSSRVAPLIEKLQAVAAQQAQAASVYEPLHLRVKARYVALADRLDNLVRKLRASPRLARLAKYVPRLPRFAYNAVPSDNQFANNLVVRRATRRAENLYQANAELRDRVRRLGLVVLAVKRTLMRDTSSLGVRALINKYRYRSIANSYTIVGSVYARRHVVGFDAEHFVLHSRCQYLLAQETAKNRFTVLLNNNAKTEALSVYLYGQGPYHLSANSVSFGDKALSTPYDLDLPNGKRIQVDRISDGTCVSVHGEVKVCCFDDSDSCSVAVSRWFTGKVNGLLGKSDNLPEKITSAAWGLDCKHFTGLLRPVSKEAVRTCYSTFGKHRRAVLKDAVLAVNPNGWKRVCESQLTADPNSYCSVVKAYANQARLEMVQVNIPDSCYKCKNSVNNKEYAVGQRIPAGESDEGNLEAASDIVFLSLGCGKDNLVDYSKFAGVLTAANPNHRYYLVKVDGPEVSVHQSAKGELFNFDVQAAMSSANQQSAGEPSDWAFSRAIFYAQSLFARRAAAARHLVILSCGNCLKYNALTVRTLAKELEKSNVVVSSFGQYNIKLDDASDLEPVGYDENDLVFVKKSDGSVETDLKSSYGFEHEGDVCYRLAVKSHGGVYNLKSLQNAQVFEHAAKAFRQFNVLHTSNLNKCAVHRSKYGGAYADFTFSNVHTHKETPVAEEPIIAEEEEDDSLDI